MLHFKSPALGHENHVSEHYALQYLNSINNPTLYISYIYITRHWFNKYNWKHGQTDIKTKILMIIIFLSKLCYWYFEHMHKRKTFISYYLLFDNRDIKPALKLDRLIDSIYMFVYFVSQNFYLFCIICVLVINYYMYMLNSGWLWHSR